jgi:hypothetical protein
MTGMILEEGPQPIWKFIRSARYRMHDNLRPVVNRQWREIPAGNQPMAATVGVGSGRDWYDDPQLERVEDEIAVWQIWRALEPGEKLTLVTHFASTDQRDAAGLLGISLPTWNRRLAAARDKFARLWLAVGNDERESHIYGSGYRPAWENGKLYIHGRNEQRVEWRDDLQPEELPPPRIGRIQHNPRRDLLQAGVLERNLETA